MPAGDILLNQFDLQVVGESGSGSQPQSASKDNGLMLYVNRGDDTGGEDQIVYAIFDIDGNVVFGPAFLPNQIIFAGASRFLLEPVGTATGFALMWVETSFGGSLNRRNVFTHILDNGTVSVNPKAVDSLPCAENNPVSFMRANHAGDRLGILYNMENGAQGTTPREFRFTEMNLTGTTTISPITLDAEPGGSQVINIQNPMLVPDLDDSGWGIFWGSNQGGTTPDIFSYARATQGGSLVTPKTVIVAGGTGNEQNLFDVAATNTGFAILLEREVGFRDNAIFLHVSQNGSTVSSELNVSEVVQKAKDPGRAFDPNLVNPGRGSVITDPTGGVHTFVTDRVVFDTQIDFLPSAVDVGANTITIPELGNPFTTIEANFSSTGSLPTPMVSGPSQHFISNEHSGNDDVFHVYTDFFDAIVDQNRVDILDQGSGTHSIAQQVIETWAAYSHIDESANVTQGPHLVNFNPALSSTRAENDNNHIQLIDNDNIQIHGSELINPSPTERALNSKIVNRITGVTSTVFEISQTVFGTNFTRIGGLRDTTSGKRGTFMQSRPSSNQMTIINSLLAFVAVNDQGTDNLVQNNLEVAP